MRVGDAVARWDGAAFETDVVASKADIVAEGLYNPYTLSGTIVVDGVLASYRPRLETHQVRAPEPAALPLNDNPRLVVGITPGPS